MAGVSLSFNGGSVRNSHEGEGGLQGWSLGETYPWSVVVVERYSNDVGGLLKSVVYRAQNLVTGDFADHVVPKASHEAYKSAEEYCRMQSQG